MSVSISKCQACDLGTSDEVKSPSELAYHQQGVDLLITMWFWPWIKMQWSIFLVFIPLTPSPVVDFVLKDPQVRWKVWGQGQRNSMVSLQSQRTGSQGWL